MERVYLLIVHRPKLVLLLIVLLTVFFASHARHIRLDGSVERLLPGNDPENQYYAEVRELFGNDEVGVIAVVSDNIYAAEVLQKIQRLTKEIEKVDGVASVLSLANAADPVADVTEPPFIMPQIPTTPAAATALREKLADRPIYLKILVAPDGRAAAINVFFAEMSSDEFIRRGIDDTIQNIVERENATAVQEQRPERWYYTGLPHFKVYSTKMMQRDLARFVPLTLLFIVLVLFLCFRSLRGVLLPTLTVMVSLIWTLGIMVLSGGALSLGSMALPPLVLVVGVAYSLRVIAEYYELARPDRSPKEVVLETVRRINTPALMAALTTVLGFFVQALNPIVSIREMGIYSSLGITLAFVFSLTLVPALLATLRLPNRRVDTFAPGLSAWLRRLTSTVMRRRSFIIAACAMVALLAAYQIPKIQVNSDFQSFFRPSDPIRQATDVVSRQLAGSMAFNVVIDGTTRDIMKQWETLRRIRTLQEAIDALPGVDKTVSFVDYCLLIDRGVQEGSGGLEVSPNGELIESAAQPSGMKTTFLDNPEQLKGVMQLFAGRPKSLALVVNPEFSRTNILVRTSLSGSNDIAATVDKIHTLAAEILPPGLKAHPTGSIILLIKTTGDLVSGQAQSLTLTAVVIFILMAAMFLSVRVGAIAMIPYLFTLLAFFGLIGASGVVFNLGTNTIALVILGITVDSTIHLMTRLSFELRASADQEPALLQTLATVGKSNLYVSSSFFLCFLVYGFSTFVAMQQFGLLSATAMIVTLAANVVLLPALLASRRILTVWDLLYTVTQLTQRLEQRVVERTQELQEVNRQLEDASRHKSEFLARMSHELRTPMNAIIGFTRLVMRRAKDTLPKREHENLGKVLISAEHLLTLINDILDLSKVEAGRMEVHAVRFELEPLIKLCLHTVEPLIKHERLRLVKKLEGGMPELFTDQDKLKQILMNLLSNAIKFTEAGTITVTAQCRDKEVTISVADTGIGIPSDQLTLVFEEFHQVDNSATRQYSGTGLGLAISRHFAQLLGGDIKIQSTVGVGSTFTVIVPLHYDTAQLTEPVAFALSREALTTTEIGAVAPAIENPPEVKS